MSNVKILTPKGFRSFYKVAKKQGECIEISFADKSIKCTIDHRFENEGKEIVANTLKVGDILNGFEIIGIKNIGIQTVYTPVMVADGHKYLSKGLINFNCSFIGSTATLIDGQFLDKMVAIDPIRQEDNYHLNIFEDPIPGALYVMGVDSSTGVGNDFCVIQVLKINSKDSYEQVAVYQNNKIKPYEFANVIAILSSRYNEAQMVLENNDCGRQVAEELWYNIGCGNVLRTDRRGDIGTRATHDTKLQACMMLKKSIETGKLMLHDNETINQLSRYEEVSPNVFRGGKGQHDDLVSALYWAVFCLNQPQIDLEGAKVVSQNVVDDYAPPPCMFDESSDNSDFWRSFR